MAYVGPVVDPFRLKGPDGRTYFDILGPPVGLVTGWAMVVKAIDNYRRAAVRARTPRIRLLNEGRAVRLEKALLKAKRDLDLLAVRCADLADRRIVQNIKASQLRPDTTHHRVHLKDVIESRPLPLPFSVPTAAVGIADIDKLKKRVYWEAQEFGSTHNVGRELRGFFQPGSSPAQQSEFRNHPAFRPTKGGPRMLIQRPIPERAFLRRGVEAVGRYRQRELIRIQNDLIREMTAAVR